MPTQNLEEKPMTRIEFLKWLELWCPELNRVQRSRVADKYIEALKTPVASQR